MVVSNTMVPLTRILEIFDEDNDRSLVFRDILRWFLLRFFKEKIPASTSYSYKFFNLGSEEDVQEFGESSSNFVNRMAEASRFKITEVGKWLVQNHLYYRKEYESSHLSIYNRYKNKDTTIKGKIEELVTLGIIGKIGTVKSQKNILQTPLYSFTKFGVLVALTYVATKGKHNDALASSHLLINYWMHTIIFDYSESHSLYRFLMTFITLGSNDLENFRFFFMILFLYFSTPDYRKLRGFFLSLKTIDSNIHKLFLKSLEKLDQQSRKMFILQMKLDIESNIANKVARLPDDWESIRLDYINDSSTLIIIGECSKCNTFQTLKFNIYDFLELPSVNENDKIKTLIDCPICKEKKAVQVSPDCYYYYD
jgi:hypothetical protein